MATPAEFFHDLATRREPLLEHLSGTLRIDLRRNGTVERWFLTIDDGNVRVSHKNARAGCIAKMDEDLFGGITRGEVNAVSAAFRGDIEVEGQPALLLAFQRLFPGPPAPAAGRAEKIRSAR
jgi:putative sterol carrier protein